MRCSVDLKHLKTPAMRDKTSLSLAKQAGRQLRASKLLQWATSDSVNRTHHGKTDQSGENELIQSAEDIWQLILCMHPAAVSSSARPSAKHTGIVLSTDLISVGLESVHAPLLEACKVRHHRKNICKMLAA